MIPSDDFEKNQIKQIGLFFAQLRYKRKLGQREIGNEIGSGQAWVSRLEKGEQDFRFSTLQKLARAYGYRLEVSVIPLDPEINTRIVAVPNDEDPVVRTNFDTNGGRTFGDRKRPIKQPKRKQKPTTPIVPDVEYETEDEFDIEKEMAATRARLGLS